MMIKTLVMSISLRIVDLAGRNNAGRKSLQAENRLYYLLRPILHHAR